MHVDRAPWERGRAVEQALKTGTTTVAFVARDYVVLATDTRATAGFFIAHRKVKKIHKIADHIALTIAGRVADAQSMIDILRANARYYEVVWGRPIDVKTLASLASNLMFGYRFFPYQAQLLVGGVDGAGPHILSIDPLGSATEEQFVATGSGSPVALGVLENEYRRDMPLDEAIGVAFKSVASAIRRDIGSGDSIEVAYISASTKYRELSPAEKAPLYDAFVKPYLLT